MGVGFSLALLFFSFARYICIEGSEAWGQDWAAVKYTIRAPCCSLSFSLLCEVVLNVRAEVKVELAWSRAQEKELDSCVSVYTSATP